MLSVVPRLVPGSVFAERFRILSFVGQGNMGSVYRAEPVAGGPAVALKLLKGGNANEPRALERFQREVEGGRRIQNPYAARTLDAGVTAEGLRWLTTEFAEGASLAELVRSARPLARADALRVLSQLFAAVAAAHEAGIVHRDLKPENVRVSGTGPALQVKVLDFGITTVMSVDPATGTTPPLGMSPWTAPEQGRPGYWPVPAADVWALGLLTFLTLTGVSYWQSFGDGAGMTEPAPELPDDGRLPATQRAAELSPQSWLPPGFDAWFARAVARDPGQRFSDASEAWTALQQLLTAEELAPAKERASLVVRPGAFVTLVITSVVLAGLVIFWLLRSMHI